VGDQAPPPAASAILRTDALTCRYGALIAVDHVDLAVEAGEVFGLVGPNGAGKSTLIRMLVTLQPPTEGTAQVDGFDLVRQAAAVRRVIGYVPQMVSADSELTGRQNLLISASLYDVRRRERRQRVLDALSLMGLEASADRLVQHYSGGMIRRLEIAQAMLHRPRVLFLDEPTVGLDPMARKTVWDCLVRLRDDFGTTLFLTTHLMEEAESLCHRVAIIHRGALAALGTPADLKASLHDPQASLDDVFIHYAGDTIEAVGSYRDTARARRVAKRLG